MRLRLTMVVAVLLVVLGATAAMGQLSDVDFAAQLTPQQEVQEPPVVSRARGGAAFDVRRADGSAEIDYEVRVRRIDKVTAAHIHLGCAGENGPVVVTLFTSETPTGRVDGVLATGTITREDLEGPLEGSGLGALIRAMQTGCTYVNVHTTDYPAGEIRGQIQQVSEVP